MTAGWWQGGGEVRSSRTFASATVTPRARASSPPTTRSATRCRFAARRTYASPSLTDSIVAAGEHGRKTTCRHHLAPHPRRRGAYTPALSGLWQPSIPQCDRGRRGPAWRSGGRRRLRSCCRWLSARSGCREPTSPPFPTTPATTASRSAAAARPRACVQSVPVPARQDVAVPPLPVLVAVVGLVGERVRPANRPTRGRRGPGAEAGRGAQKESARRGAAGAGVSVNRGEDGRRIAPSRGRPGAAPRGADETRGSVSRPRSR